MGVNNQSVSGLNISMNQQENSKWDQFWTGVSAQSNYGLYDGGFVGLTKDSGSKMESEINTNIINPCNDLIEGFGATQEKVEEGLKGEAAVAATNYIAAVKQLLEAYVSTYRSFIQLMNSTLESMEANDTANAAIIDEASSEIKNMASQIEVN